MVEELREWGKEYDLFLKAADRIEQLSEMLNDAKDALLINNIDDCDDPGEAWANRCNLIDRISRALEEKE